MSVIKPAKKANELIYKFKSVEKAIICVDEIISIVPYQDYKETLCPYDGAELSVNYWQEVKQILTDKLK